MDNSDQLKSNPKLWFTAIACGVLAIICVLVFLFQPGYQSWSDQPEFPYLEYALWYCAGGLLCLGGCIICLTGLVLLSLKRIRIGVPGWIALVVNLCAIALLGYALEVFKGVSGP